MSAPGSRVQNLLAGMIVEPGFSKKHAQEIAKMTLTHLTINGGTAFGIVRYGDVIHRKELIKILLELVSQAENPDQTLTKIQHARY